ncbi:MAG: FAD-dependent oxidoreductase, partial [Clostridia bacterium]
NIFSKPDIEQEYLFRKNHAFECTLIDSRSNPFSFPLINGIYCENGGAELNPYLFTKQMIESSKNQNNIYENTNIKSLKLVRGKWLAKTAFNNTITANKVILATGFNYELINETDLCERFITYSVVTDPVADNIIYNNTLIQDDGDPYHYMRMLPDNRIIFGGEDTKYNEKDINEKDAEKKYNKLLIDLKNLLPKYAKQIKLSTSFCGCFGSTDNNLGLIGKTTHKNLFYFFSCGANGIINSFTGSDIILSLLENKHHKLEKLFSPLRTIKKHR